MTAGVQRIWVLYTNIIHLLTPLYRANRILISMAVITLVSILAFAFEAWRLGFVPMFSYGVPHAYSYFHIKGSITLLYPAYWSQVFPLYTV